MACVKVTGTVTRSGNLAGPCTLQVEIKKNGIVVATLPVPTTGPGNYGYSYQDNNAVTSHTYTASAAPMNCVCAVSSASVVWTADNAPPPPPPSGGVRCTSAGNVAHTLDGRTNFATPAVDGTMTGGEIYTIKLIPGAFMNTAGRTDAQLNLLSWNSRAGNAEREVSVSPCIGDFDSTDAQKMYLPTPGMGVGDGGGLRWVLDEPARVVAGRIAKITSGRDWYVNIRNNSCNGSIYGPNTCRFYWFAIPAANY